MSETKTHQFRPPLYHRDTLSGRAASKPATAESAAGNEQKGWDAYRKWLSTMGAKKPATERVPLDHSIYSWKGYHSWADRVKQSWKPED